MGFFDTITDTSSSTTSASPDIIIDETVVVSSSGTSAETVPDAVGEIFETTKDGVSFVSENEPAATKPAAEISFIQDVSELSAVSEDASGDSEASSTTAILEISDAPESSNALETTGVLEISEWGVSEESTQNEPASQASEISFISNVNEHGAAESEAIAVEEAPSITSPATLIQEQPIGEEDLLDADSTIKRAIAELVANASKIQLKVDAALEEEARLLDEISQQKKAHEIAVAALKKAATAARKTADEIKQSGQRTAQLQKLLEDQLV